MTAAASLIRRSRAARLAVVAGALAAVVLLLPLVLPSPYEVDVANRLQSPSWSHPFGTDQFGRDVLVRVVAAARVSWLVGVIAAVSAVVIGSIYGSAAAMIGGRVESVAMRLLEIVLAFPGLLLALVLSMVIGPGLRTVVIVLAFVYAAPVARLVRGLVRDEVSLEYVEAAVLVGASKRRLLSHHLARNVAPSVLVFSVTVAAESILVEAGLSFLGAGVSPPTPAWGSMIADGQDLVFAGVWWVALPSGVAIAASILMCNRISDAIVDEMASGSR